MQDGPGNSQSNVSSTSKIIGGIIPMKAPKTAVMSEISKGASPLYEIQEFQELLLLRTLKRNPASKCSSP